MKGAGMKDRMVQAMQVVTHTARKGGTGILPVSHGRDAHATMKIPDRAVKNIFATGLTYGSLGGMFTLNTTPGSFGERAQSHSIRDGSCIFGEGV